ncbi:MAG: MMPL family transporter [Alphaproteobacteria bacterium]|nr:MMPL family transporter [Alphaproteobacteria bacterium]
MRGNPAFVLVQNGRPYIPPDVQAYLLEHRYLLGSDLSPTAFSPVSLKQSLEQSIQRLATVTGWAFRDLFPRDPTGRMRDVVAGLQWQDGPERIAGIWQDTSGRALILARLHAAAGDLAAQAAAVEAVGLAVTQANSSLVWEASGPGLFGLHASDRIRGDMTWLSALAGGAVALVLLLAFRRIGPVVLAGVPVCLGILVGILVTQVIFGSVHGVAITFGAVLSGVAVDYPIHLIGLRQHGDTAWAVARRISRPMIIGAATTSVGLLALTQSSFPGLAQIGTLASVGVITALLCSLIFLPFLVGCGTVSPNPLWTQAIWGYLRQRPGLRRGGRVAFLGIFLGAVVFAILSPAPVWERDLSRLSVAQGKERRLDAELRHSFKLPDARQLLLIEGPDAQSVLQRQAALLPLLDKAMAEGRLGRYFAAATILPTLAVQHERQNMMPDREGLVSSLTAATEGLPVSTSTFRPFIEDVADQKHKAALDVTALRNSPLGPFFLAPWPVLNGYAGIIALSAPIQLQDEQLADTLVDLVQVAGEIITDYRNEAMTLLLIGLGVGMILLVVGLRNGHRIFLVALPPLAAVMLTAALLLAFGIELNLFHVLAFLLIASVGVDYSLFYPGYGEHEEMPAHGIRSVTLCCVTTVTVFGILSTSSIPVLSAIGMTVAIGAGVSYLLTVFCAE